ncbi:PLD nuclease N-terminal domain-containing protein [Frankia sp. Cppng1_Ct_nod]|uniref:PLD nuclease N-terminal domain-containing protein n=1 Tax=Frankia sp. Cppng1_Ct_nod TaxID=2897162 RepID=UPI0013EF6014|nr:PLD nuclease N-terminal domain-containing protein [Frankia sp. Cppng1_Ct_nod]
MLGFVLTLVLISFWVCAIIDAIVAPAVAVRTLPKIAWIGIIVLFYVVGAMAWFLLGHPRADVDPTENSDHPVWGGRRPRARSRGLGWGDRDEMPTGRVHPRIRRAPAPRPIAPDDDPEFLRELSERIRRGDGDGPPRS